MWPSTLPAEVWWRPEQGELPANLLLGVVHTEDPVLSPSPADERRDETDEERNWVGQEVEK